MKSRRKNEENRKNRTPGFYTYVLSSFLFLLFSISAFSQDSIPIAKDLTEEKELNFQQFFFKALSEKSIGNYKKAIKNLESCNKVLKGNTAVYFEFSKNYMLLKKPLLSKEYINKALQNEPNNIWMLKHLVQIDIKGHNFSDAILTQQKVVAIDIKERELLMKLYLQNREYKKAISLMNAMEYDNALSSSFKQLKNTLERNSSKALVKEEINDFSSLEDQFKEHKSYVVLKQLLIASKDTSDILLKYADKGIMLFPTTPFVYLMKGKALNYQKMYKKALLSLENGLNFVVDDIMEVNFYKEMADSYKGLGNSKEEKKFIEKSKKIKN